MRDDNQSADPSLSISTFSPKRYQEQASPRGSLLSCSTNWFSGNSLRQPFPLKLLAVLIISPPLKPIYTYTHINPPTYNNLSIWDQPPLQPPSPILNRVKGQLTPIFRLSCSRCSIPAHSYYPSWAISSLIWTRNNAKHRSNLQALEELQSIPAQIQPLEPLPR